MAVPLKRVIVVLGLAFVSVHVDRALADSSAGASARDESSQGQLSTPRPAQPSAAFGGMAADQVQSQLLQWLARAKVDETTAKQATALWADSAIVRSMSAEETLDRLVASFAKVDETARQLVESARHSGSHEPLNLEGIRSDPFFRNHVQLYQARWLTQHRFYDEAIVILESLDPEAVVDPASLFFYRAICRLKLLKPAEAGDDIALLLNNTLDVPPRFRAVAEMMKAEAGLETDGLPQVTRLMSDVHRRLDLGRSDEPVQKREDEVIAALDKLLEEMEKQKQQQQQSGNGNGGQQNQPGDRAANQSTIKGSAAEGTADSKELKETGNWGMLDQQAETKARELIRQQFPPNFLDAISRYTRRIAEQKK